MILDDGPVHEVVQGGYDLAHAQNGRRAADRYLSPRYLGRRLACVSCSGAVCSVRSLEIVLTFGSDATDAGSNNTKYQFWPWAMI